MYPNLYYLFKDLFGIEIQVLKPLNTVGFFIALSILVAGWIWKKDLYRKQSNGELIFLEKKVLIGLPASASSLILSFSLGFITGFKIGGLLLTKGALGNIGAYIFSFQGNLIAGFVIAFISATLKWAEKKYYQLQAPVWEVMKESPSMWVAKASLAAGISGVAGCKFLAVFENWQQFKANPVQILLSPNDFTYYGGLLLATITMWLWHYKWGIYRMRIADAMAPGLMLGYAVGRAGCQLSGDGDWGLANTQTNPFRWLPDWLWAFDYPHNAIFKGEFITGCTWDNYCYRLSTPVYPTPLYEIILAIILFVLLWSIRKKIKTAGKISALYLILNGIERFIIEFIRVNPRNEFWGISITNSQAFAILYIIAGVLLYIFCPKLAINKLKKEA